MIYLFNLFVNSFYLYFLVSILINQYYSVSRFIKVITSFLLKKKNIILLLLNLGTIPILLISKVSFYVLNILLVIIFYLVNRPLKFNFTRRNLLLIIISLIISIFVLPIFIFTSLVILLLVFYIVLPYELLIKRYYLKKAKKKLNNIDPFIIGISGSYGKTSFKNILYNVLKTKYQVSMPLGNINTLMGITRFINDELKINDEILIVELGIDSSNGMSKFKKLLKLDIGVLTSIGENHLSNFKTLENTFISKMKIKELLKEDGKLFLNDDSLYLKDVEEKGNIIKYTKNNIDIISSSIEGIKVKIQGKEVNINLVGKYNFAYIDGVIKISEELNVPKEYVGLGLKEIKPIKRRLEVKKYKDGYFINNSYNVNLNGVKEALDLLSSLEGSKVVILGGMIEQGKYYYINNNKIKDLLVGYNVILINPNKVLTRKNKYKSLYRVKSLDEAYTLVDRYHFKNILLLASPDSIYLK